MRSLRLLLLAAFLVAAGCSDGSGDQTTTSFAAIPGVPDRPAIEVVEEMLAAMNAADPAALLDYHHPNAVVTSFEGDSFSIADTPGSSGDDFDGDGVATSADVIQWNFAMRESWGERSTWECRKIDEASVQCTLSTTNDVIGTGPGLDWLEIQSFRVEAGLIVEVRSMTDPDYNALSDTTMVNELFAYERWINQEHPERWSELFEEPCCNLDFKRSPGTVPIHKELMAEFIETR
ncbi:MAG: hypothetical protein QNJ89_07125 [Acidimicrobiia bacterium]|nr:hypothetical protein [Acidimicrobiia bacterium]